MTVNEMTINEMIKKLKEHFGDDIQYKAVSKDGKVFKTQGFDDYKKSIDSRNKV